MEIPKTELDRALEQIGRRDPTIDHLYDSIVARALASPTAYETALERALKQFAEQDNLLERTIANFDPAGEQMRKFEQSLASARVSAIEKPNWSESVSRPLPEPKPAWVPVADPVPEQRAIEQLALLRSMAEASKEVVAAAVVAREKSDDDAAKSRETATRARQWTGLTILGSIAINWKSLAEFFVYLSGLLAQ